jgi:hypothetical protein
LEESSSPLVVQDPSFASGDGEAKVHDSVHAVTEALLKNKLPLVITVNHETAPSIFESEINKRFLLFAGTEEYEEICFVYEGTAKPFKGQIIFVLVDLANREVAAPVLEFFSLAGDKMTGVVSATRMIYRGSVNGVKSAGSCSQEVHTYWFNWCAPCLCDFVAVLVW